MQEILDDVATTTRAKKDQVYQMIRDRSVERTVDDWDTYFATVVYNEKQHETLYALSRDGIDYSPRGCGEEKKTKPTLISPLASKLVSFWEWVNLHILPHPPVMNKRMRILPCTELTDYQVKQKISKYLGSQEAGDRNTILLELGGIKGVTQDALDAAASYLSICHAGVWTEEHNGIIERKLEIAALDAKLQAILAAHEAIPATHPDAHELVMQKHAIDVEIKSLSLRTDSKAVNDLLRQVKNDLRVLCENLEATRPDQVAVREQLTLSIEQARAEELRVHGTASRINEVNDLVRARERARQAAAAIMNPEASAFFLLKTAPGAHTNSFLEWLSLERGYLESKYIGSDDVDIAKAYLFVLKRIRRDLPKDVGKLEEISARMEVTQFSDAIVRAVIYPEADCPDIQKFPRIVFPDGIPAEIGG